MIYLLCSLVFFWMDNFSGQVVGHLGSLEVIQATCSCLKDDTTCNCEFWYLAEWTLSYSSAEMAFVC